MKKKVFIFLLSLFLVSNIFANFDSEKNKILSENIELKTRTFLTDFIDQQYRLTTGKELSSNRVYEISDAIIKASKDFEISPLLIAAIIDTETNFRNILGKMGEIGYMQIRPSTAVYVMDKFLSIFKENSYSNEDPEWVKKRLLNDPKFNIYVGTAYMKYLMDSHDQDFYKAIGWYNGGGNEYYAKKVIYKMAEITVTYPSI